jgi:hypothetical protein
MNIADCTDSSLDNWGPQAFVEWTAMLQLLSTEKEDKKTSWHADHLKLMFPMCWSVVQIAWAMIDGLEILKGGTFDGKSNYAWALQTLIHGVNFLLRCHYKDDAFVIQVRHLTLTAHCPAMDEVYGWRFCANGPVSAFVSKCQATLRP